MNITFADPGLDPTYYIVTGIIAAVPSVLSLIFVVSYLMRSSRKSRAGDWAFKFSMVALAALVVGVGMVGNAGTFTTYQHRVDEALYAELTSQGFELIQIEESDRRSEPDIIRAVYKGKDFSGTIENLNYPTGYTFMLTETEKAS